MNKGKIHNLLKIQNDNHILIEVLNKNGDLKLTKFRNPRAIWQKYDYPDEYTFRDVDIVNVFQLQQENQKYKEVINKSIKYISSNDIEVLKYHDIPSETTSYEIVTVDLLKILKGEINEKNN